MSTCLKSAGPFYLPNGSVDYHKHKCHIHTFASNGSDSSSGTIPHPRCQQINGDTSASWPMAMVLDRFAPRMLTVVVAPPHHPFPFRSMVGRSGVLHAKRCSSWRRPPRHKRRSSGNARRRLKGWQRGPQVFEKRITF